MNKNGNKGRGCKKWNENEKKSDDMEKLFNPRLNGLSIED